MTFISNLRYGIDRYFGGNVASFAKAAGLNATTVHGILSDGRKPRLDTATAMAKALGVGLDNLISGIPNVAVSKPYKVADGDYDAFSSFLPVPRRDLGIQAGPGSWSDLADDSPERHLMFDAKWLAKKNLDASRLTVAAVHGDSMTPDLNDGDAILLDEREIERPNQRGIYLVRTIDGLSLKRVRWVDADKQWRLVSRNDRYSDLIYPEIELLALVVWRGCWIAG